MTNPTYHRTNLNLYIEDVAYMQATYGRGWTEQARDIIHQEIKAIRRRTPAMQSLHEIEEDLRNVGVINDGK